MKIHLNLPPPPKSASPNAREHWGTKAQDTALYKSSVYLLARNARQLTEGMFPLKAPVTCIITFIVPDKRRRDFDNLLASFKAGFDGIVEAGVLADDSAWGLRIGMEIELGKKAGVKVILEGANDNSI